MTDEDPMLKQIEMAKRTSIGVDYVLDNAAAEIRALRARVAELEAWKERHLHDALGDLQRMGQAEEAGWLTDMENAPRDETDILSWDGKDIEVVWWDDELGEWRDMAGRCWGWQPTHWRPLPAPPTEGDA